MNIREENKKLLVQYFENGGLRHITEKIGIELEHIIVDKTTGRSVSYYGERGIGALLEKLAVHFPWRYEPEGSLLGVYNDDFSISLEPAGQLEVSINPREDISLIYRIYRMFLEQITPVLNEWGYDMLTLGYHPVSRAEDMAIIPKKRYEYMDRYFMETGTCGKNMMRGTAATQVSIDYDSEQDFILKIRCAYMLMPLFKLLTDNTPVVDGEAYEGHMARTYIWNNVDPDRTGIIPGLFDENFGFESYAEFLMNMPVIFVENQGTPLYTGDKTTEEIWKDAVFTQDDIEHILSMNFQDVRLKHYLEIRYADSMPINCVLGYAALLKGVFYQKDFLLALEKKLKGDIPKILEAQNSLVRFGFDGEAYGYPADKLLRYVIEAAKNRLGESEQLLLLPLEELVDQKKTLAGEYYENDCR
ncbi:MAG: glutamate-cysteine ligase family protein [Ruminococcus sp.]|jgi:glutamate--cysteine ligase